MDSKDHEPVLCSGHRNICSDYCKTCDSLLCSKCLRDHRLHEMVTIDEKASEVKTRLFALLTDLELEEKPLRAKKETDESVINANKLRAENLSSFIEKEMEQMKKLLLQTINETAKIEDLSEIKTAMSELLEMQQKCRNQLNLSCDSLVLTSPKVLDEIRLRQKVYQDLAGEEIESRNYDMHRLRHEFEKFQEAVSEIVLCTEKDVELQTIRHVCFNDLDYLYQVRVSPVEETISVSWINTLNDNHKIQTTYTQMRKLNSPITHVFPVFFEPALWKFILIFLENKSALKYDVHTGSLKTYPYPKMPHFLWPLCYERKP